MKKRNVILSGIRPTGRSHLGNYIGAYRYFVELSNDPTNECFYFIANYHALTTQNDPKALKEDLNGIVLDFLGAGIDPGKAVIYSQSSVSSIIADLAWILGCLTPVSNLLGMPHFKEKREEAREGAEISENAGLLCYPVLMAADILAVKANLVPVGQDQHPHVELTRDLARRFNAIYGKEVFPVPDLLKGEGLRLSGLKGEGKMSKSEEEDVIYLTDPAGVVKEKIRQAMTDPARKKRNDPGNPEICNIFTFHTLFSDGEEIARITKECRTAEIGCVECKDILTKRLNALLEEIQTRREKFEAEGPDFINELVRKGGIRARRRIQKTLGEVKELVGVPAY